MFGVPHGRYSLAWVSWPVIVARCRFCYRLNNIVLLANNIVCYPTASNGLIVSSDSVFFHLVWYGKMEKNKVQDREAVNFILIIIVNHASSALHSVL